MYVSIILNPHHYIFKIYYYILLNCNIYPKYTLICIYKVNIYIIFVYIYFSNHEYKFK